MTLTSFPNGISSFGMPVIGSGLMDLITTGSVFFVHSGTGSDGNDGKSTDYPLATIDAAVGKCTANKKDLIIVMPGHVEDLASGETIDFDVAGVTCIGLGNGPDRPRIDYNHATATVDIGANGVKLKNLTFRPSVATVTIGIDIEAGVTDTVLEDIEALPGEEGDGTDEFVLFIDIKAGCSRTVVNGLRYRHHASADGAASAIKLTGASDSCTFKNLDIIITGTAAVAGINGDTTLSTRLTIQEAIITTDGEPGVELLTGTTGVFVNVYIYAPGATFANAVVADAMAYLYLLVVDTANQSGAIVRTASS